LHGGASLLPGQTPERQEPTTYELILTLKQMTDLSGLMVTVLGIAIGVAIVGIINGEKWSHNPWLIPVLVAQLWGVLQDRKLSY
jgi:hypothetical protein